jgi:hypothetical protein
MKFPIFAFCEGDLEVCWSIAQLRRVAEPVDVSNGSWWAYNRNGVVLQLESISGVWTDEVQIAETSNCRPNALERDLRAYLLATAAANDSKLDSALVTDAPLDVLTEIAIRLWPASESAEDDDDLQFESETAGPTSG